VTIVEAARILANSTARPWGLDQPTPDQKWRERQPIRPLQRLLFRATVRNFLDGAHQEAARALELPLH
jgi:hypothetical protein